MLWGSGAIAHWSRPAMLSLSTAMGMAGTASSLRADACRHRCSCRKHSAEGLSTAVVRPPHGRVFPRHCGEVARGCRGAPPLDRPPPWILRQAIFLSRRYSKEVRGVPDHEMADAVEGVGVLPGSLRLRQFCYSAFPALARPR